MPPDAEPRDSEDAMAVPHDEWNGAWGAIEPVPQSVETLCLQVEGEPEHPTLHYFPYRTIGKWTWSMGEPETLEIQLGGIQATISGSGLRRLAEALNMGQLRLVQMSFPPVAAGEICIRNIRFDGTGS